MGSQTARIASAAWYANRGVHYKIEDCPDIPVDEDGYVPPEQTGLIADQLPSNQFSIFLDMLIVMPSSANSRPKKLSAFDAFAQKAEDFVDQLRTRITELEQQNRTLHRNLRQKGIKTNLIYA
ncbi:hypothetical protein niasHS_011468 [Heterodera schachtii]|uniref:Uncharacterized protein n=2 Tax=Heterodera TaxID=34509 RepID=A0ABD2IIM5_HETSC